MADLYSQFAGPAKFTDPTPNEEFNQAIGLGANPNDDFATSFSKALSAGMYRNSEKGQEIMADMAKQKIAEKAAEQLYQRKLELEQQYPTYTAHITPFGAIVQTSNTGSAPKISNVFNGDQNDPNTDAGAIYQSYLNQQRAAGAKAAMEARPDVINAEAQDIIQKPKLQGEMLKYQQSRENYYDAAANAKEYPPQKAPTPPTISQQNQIMQAAEYEAAGTTAKDPMAGLKVQKAMKDPNFATKRMEIFNRMMETYQANRQPGGGLGAATGAPGAGLLDLTRSPAFAPSKGMLDQ